MPFEKLLELGMPIVVLSEAVDELLEAYAQDEPIPGLRSFCNAIQERTDVHIKTPTGEDVTEEYKPLLGEAFPLPTRRTAPESSFKMPGLIKSRVSTMKSDTEQMFMLLRRESDLSSRFSNLSTRASTLASSISRSHTVDTEMTEPDEFEDSQKPPLLLTDDRKLRIQASTIGAAAIATYMMKRWVDQTRKSSRSSPPESTAMDIDGPAEIVATGP